MAATFKSLPDFQCQFPDEEACAQYLLDVKFLPMIHIVFGNLDAWLLGAHHGVSPQHLQAYLNEFVFRFNRRFWPGSAFDAVLRLGTGVRGPTYAGLYDGSWEHPGSYGATG